MRFWSGAADATKRNDERKAMDAMRTMFGARRVGRSGRVKERLKES